MSSDKKQIIAKIARDIESYASYLKENGVTEVVASSQRRIDKIVAGVGDPGSACAEPAPAFAKPATAGVGRSAGRPVSTKPVAVAPFPGPKLNHDFQTSEEQLKSIAARVAVCTKCALHKGRTKTVPGQGNPAPDILFIGEGPGEDEDRQGLAFVGRAGQLLTRLIKRMGYSREEVFIANIVKCRPPNNRKPLPEEMSACRPYLEDQIALLSPKVIVLLGASALDGLIPAELPERTISRVRGKWLEYNGVPTMPTFHPSYLFRNQSAMWDVWRDMQLVLERLGRPVPAKA